MNNDDRSVTGLGEDFDDAIWRGLVAVILLVLSIGVGSLVSR